MDMPIAAMRHMEQSRAGAAFYKEGDVNKQQTKENAFQVRADSQAGWYDLHLGDDNTPVSCSCPWFRRHYLLCKHFFAVFKCTTYNFTDLHKSYLEHPNLNLEPHFLSFLEEECIKTTSSKEQLEIEPDVDVHVSCDEPECDPDPDQQTSTPTNNALKSKFQEILKNILDASYCCDDDAPFIQNMDSLQSILQCVRAGVKEECHLKLHNDTTAARPMTTRKQGKSRHLKRTRMLSKRTRRLGMCFFLIFL